MFDDPVSYITFAILVLVPISAITGWVSTQWEFQKHEYNEWTRTYEYVRTSTFKWLMYIVLSSVCLCCALAAIIMCSIGAVKLIG